MSDYKRLVSYLYLYENGVKLKNTGYVKIDIRGKSLRMDIRIRGAREASKTPKEAYLFVREGDIPAGIALGSMRLDGSGYQLKVVTDAADVVGSGVSFEDCSGVSITCNNNLAYAAEWDDRPVNPMNLREYRGEQPAPEQPREEPPREEPPELSREPMPEPPTEPEQQKEPEEALQESPEARNDFEADASETQFPSQYPAESPQESGEALRQPMGETESGEEGEENQKARDNEYIETEALDDDAGEADASTVEPSGPCCPWAQAEEESGGEDEGRRPGEEKEPTRQGAWEDIQKNFEELRASRDSIRAFADDEIGDCFRVTPKDLAGLSKREWRLGSNSFLLHGYYNYHYLIVGRKREGEKEVIILGVPGTFYEQEKVMAGMFGFPYFKLVDEEPLSEGSFGYWYRRLEPDDKE